MLAQKRFKKRLKNEWKFAGIMLEVFRRAPRVSPDLTILEKYWWNYNILKGQILVYK